MIAILVGSHGNYAKEALKSAEMVIGEQKNTAYFTLTEMMDLSMTIEVAEVAYQSLDKETGTLILTDIVGGTPTNVATVLKKKGKNISLLAGFNMPLLLEALLNREQELEELVVYLKELFEGTLTEII